MTKTHKRVITSTNIPPNIEELVNMQYMDGPNGPKPLSDNKYIQFSD
jgi:hypothetical protein